MHKGMHACMHDMECNANAMSMQCQCKANAMPMQCQCNANASHKASLSTNHNMDAFSRTNGRSFELFWQFSQQIILSTGPRNFFFPMRPIFITAHIRISPRGKILKMNKSPRGGSRLYGINIIQGD